jgi:putative methyltransferase (TIGR04325 family)
MSARKTIEKIFRLVTPPIIPRAFARLRSGSPNYILEYAPEAVYAETDSAGGESVPGWNAENVAATERGKWEAFCRNAAGAGPLGFSHEHPDLDVTRSVPFHNVHLTFAYALALAASGKNSVSVLDWGGALGHYYQIGKALLPDLHLDFHCKELPNMVEVGRLLNPEVHWYADDSCLERSYDLVMMNGSLQCFPEWRPVLRRVSAAAGAYFFLTRVPVVENSPTFAAWQQVYDSKMIHMQFNQDELLQAAADCGLEVFREVVVGDRPYIHNAPEQCELRGWIFRRRE